MIDFIPVLANDHLRVRASDAAHHGGVAALAVREHVVVGGDLRAVKRDAVEDV
ncbi:hypothetical protein D3C72_2531440 [compost metagenome]